MYKKVFIVLAISFLVNAVYGKKSDCPTIKLKRQWGGHLSKIIDYRPIPIKYVIIHHTVTSQCTTFLKCAELLQNMQHYHINDLEYNDIGYK